MATSSVIKWKGPTFIKKNMDGKQIQIYKFTIDDLPSYLSFTTTSDTDHIELEPTKYISADVWKDILEQFIQPFGRLFAKPLTGAAIYKNLTHVPSTKLNKENTKWVFDSLTIEGGRFYIYWQLSEETIQQIDIDLQTDETDSIVKPLDDIDINGDSIEDITNTLKKGNNMKAVKNVSYLQREKARQRVKEARLNARLAYFRAKQEISKYEEKYGGYESEYPYDDSSDGDSFLSEGDESDDSGVSE